jgi:hypothetical protein
VPQHRNLSELASASFSPNYLGYSALTGLIAGYTSPGKHPGCHSCRPSVRL